jgi:hypothetical protein
MYECAAYIPDMSCEDSKRACHCQRRARYEARLRAGVALYPAPLGAGEIDALVALGWLSAWETSTRRVLDCGYSPDAIARSSRKRMSPSLPMTEITKRTRPWLEVSA